MKQKLTLLMLALLTCAGAWATDIIVGTATGTFHNWNSGTSSYSEITPSSSNQFAKKWVSYDAPTLTITCGSNNMVINGSDDTDTKFRLHSDTYTLSIDGAYLITGYSITAYAANGSSTINGTTVGKTDEAATTVSQTNLVANTAVFTVASTDNPWMYVKSFTVTIAPIPTYDANHTSYDILYTTGVFSRTDGGSSENSNNTWVSSEISGLTYTSNYNSMGKATVNGINYTCFHSGNSPTYTITAPTGYLIAGYSMEVFGTANQYLQPTGYTKAAISTDSSNPTKIYVANINAQTATMQRTTGSNWAYITSFKVYLIPVYTVTYTIVDGAATVSGGSAVQVKKGSAPNIANTVGANPSSSYNNPYCTYSYFSDASCETPITEITSACTVYAKITGTSSVPVEFASAVDDGDAQWYTLKLRDYQFYVSGETVTLNSSDITSASAQWVFTGSVCNAYVYNKEAEKYLVMSDGACALSDTPQPWILAPHQSGAGFYLYYASDYKFPFRNSSGYLAYSTGPFYETANAASFVATEVAADYSEDIVANVKPFFTTGVGSYFGLKSTVQSTYADRVEAAKISCDADEYSALLAVVSNPANFVYPESGYYRIKNYSTAYYLGKTGSAPTIEFANTNAASVLYLTRSGEEGSYTYSIKMQGTDYEGPADQATGDYTLTIVAPGLFTMNDYNSNTIFGYTYASGTAIATESLATGGDAAYWTLETATTATITLNSDGAGTPTCYATLYLPFDATITGADAFTLAKSGSYLVPTAITENEVPAGTPVLLKGTSSPATATINTGAAFNSGSPLACDLTGTYTDMSVTKTEDVSDDYFLGKDGTTVGFYKWDGSTLKANRAYLDQSTAEAAVKGYILMFDDDATSINSLTPALSEGKGAIYNLAGQRISKMQKGINIVNGKKILK